MAARCFPDLIASNNSSSINVKDYAISHSLLPTKVLPSPVDNAIQHSPNSDTQPSVPPSAKRQRLAADRTKVPADLGELVARDAELLKCMGWQQLVNSRRHRDDFPETFNFRHPSANLLKTYKHRGAPIKLHTVPWSQKHIKAAMDRGAHKSCYEHLPFLEDEFVDMINKSQWIVLPFDAIKHMTGLRISPPGIVPQRGRRPRWIVDYTWSGVNPETLPLAPGEAMQFGHALERYLREILLADPELGKVYLAKFDISDGFYRIHLNVDDIFKLAVVFPTPKGQPALVALPLVLPMGWKNSPPIFSAFTETAADIANANLNTASTPHPLESHAAVCDDSASTATLSSPNQHANTGPIPPPTLRDPCLPTSRRSAQYIDVFVDDFLAICQGTHNQDHVRRTLLHAVDQVLRPLDDNDDHYRTEPISVKKLRKGDGSWNTIKAVLGWIINTETMTIHLPKHRQDRLQELLDQIPHSQKRISVKKWHKMLGELRSMALALPGARNMFSPLQNALTNAPKHRITISKGVHQALNDFRWMLANISSRPTRIAELIPLLVSALGYHDASGQGAGGVWYPTSSLVPRSPSPAPILWRFQWPQDIVASLVTEANPTGTVTNSDLELAGGLIHLDVLAQTFDIRERTVLSKTDNLPSLFWQRKGNSTKSPVPAHLLRLFGIHQRLHRYVPRHDYIPGLSNPMADDASRMFDKTNSQLLSHFNLHYHYQDEHYKIVKPSIQITSSVISALRRKTSKPESLLAVPPPPVHTGPNGPSTQLAWASIPLSKPSKTKYQCYKSSSDAFEPGDVHETAIPYALDQLKSTYGRLRKRSSHWGPLTHGSIPVAT